MFDLDEEVDMRPVVPFVHVNGVDVVDPAGHWYPAEHGPLHVPDDCSGSSP